MMTVLDRIAEVGAVETRPHVVTQRLLMCRPTHYGIEYEINPWMSRDRAADTPKVQAQWRGLHATLSKFDTRVHLIPPQPRLPCFRRL